MKKKIDQQRAVEVWRKKTKIKIIEGFGGSCNKCGYTACGQAFDVHHIDPNEKEFGISNIYKSPRAWKKIVAELKKCILLCCRCHRELHCDLWSLDDLNPINYFDESKCESVQEIKTGVCPVCENDVFLGRKTCSKSCAARLARKIDWPSDEEFLTLVENNSFAKVAQLLNVSSSGVQKHLIRTKKHLSNKL